MSRRGGRGKSYVDEDSPEPEPKRQGKRSSQQPSTSQETVDDDEPGNWSCSVCTYRNSFEAFKCEICESRKGTSTRKPRLNSSVVQQQTLVQLAAVQQQSTSQSSPSTSSTKRIRTEKSRFSPESNDSSSPTPSRIIKKHSKLKKEKERRIVPFSDDIVFRNSPKKRKITVRNITFEITEYKQKKSAKGKQSLDKLKKESKKEGSV